MALYREFGRGVLAALLAAVGAQAGAVVPATAATSPSVNDRIAAIRAKAAELPGALSHDAATPSVDQPAQIAWNDWKNQ